MKINILELDSNYPLYIEQEEYDQLVKEGAEDKTWSQCSSSKEWLAKLHYLRNGFKLGKIEVGQFHKREAKLIVSWLRKWC